MTDRRNRHSRDHQIGQPGRHHQDRQLAHGQPPPQYAGQLEDRPPIAEHDFGQQGYQTEYDNSYDQEEYTDPNWEHSQNDYDGEPGNSIMEEQRVRYEVIEPDHRERPPSHQHPNMGRYEEGQEPVGAGRGPQIWVDPSLHESAYGPRPSIGHHSRSGGYEQEPIDQDHHGSGAQSYIGHPHISGQRQDFYNPTGRQTEFSLQSSEPLVWQGPTQYSSNMPYAPPTMPYDPMIAYDGRVVYVQRAPYTQGFPRAAPADRPRPYPYTFPTPHDYRGPIDPHAMRGQPTAIVQGTRVGEVRQPQQNVPRPIYQDEEVRTVLQAPLPLRTPRHDAPTHLRGVNVQHEREETVHQARVSPEITQQSAHAQPTSFRSLHVQHGQQGTVTEAKVPPKNPWNNANTRSTVPPSNVQHERKAMIDPAQPPSDKPRHSGDSGRQPMSQMRSKDLASVDPKGKGSTKSVPTLAEMPELTRGDSSAINEQLQAKRSEIKMAYNPSKPKGAAKPKSTPKEPKADQETSFKEVRHSNIKLPKATLPATTQVPNPNCANFGCDADDHLWKDCPIPWYCARCGGVEHCHPGCPWKVKPCPKCRRAGHAENMCDWWRQGNWSDGFRDAQRTTRHEYRRQLRDNGSIHRDIFLQIDANSKEWKSLPWVRHQRKKGALSGPSASKGQLGNRYELLTAPGVHQIDEDAAQELVRSRRAMSSKRDQRHDQSLGTYIPDETQLPGAEEEAVSEVFEDAESTTETGSASIMDQTQVAADADRAGVTNKGSKGQANMARPTEKSSSKAKQATSKTPNSERKGGKSHDKPASSSPEDAPHDNDPDQSTGSPTGPSTGPSTEPPPGPSTESEEPEVAPSRREKRKKNRGGK